MKTLHLILCMLAVIVFSSCQINKNKNVNAERGSSRLLLITVDKEKGMFDNGDFKTTKYISNIPYYLLKKIEISKGEVGKKQILCDFGIDSPIIDVVEVENPKRLLLLTYSGDYYIYNSNGKTPEKQPLRYQTYIDDVYDWSQNGDYYLAGIISYRRLLLYYKLKEGEELLSLYPYVRQITGNQDNIALQVWDAKFVPDSDDRKIAVYGMYFDDSKEIYKGFILVYDTKSNKAVFIKKDFGIMNDLYFTVAETHGKAPRFSLSPDGKKAAYIADFDTPAERKKGDASPEKWDKAPLLWDTLGLYVIDLQDEKKEPELVEMGRPFDDRIVWSPDGKYILARGKLFIVKDKGFEAVEINPDFNPKYYDDTAFSPDGNYLVYGQDGEKKDEKVWYVLYLPEKKIIPLEEDVLEMDWER